MKPLKILHTSDWHLGRQLHGQNRYDEFKSFLEWLSKTIHQEAIDVLLVAGDIFDNTTPSHSSQELYYQFLKSILNSTCQHVAIIAGNHDSPTLMNAPKDILSLLNVYVVGSMPEKIEDEVLVLNDKNQVPLCIVCAVPYLRDRDIRTSVAGESMADKNLKLISGVQNHYRQVYELALQKKKALNVPLVAMGHLFAAGGQIVEEDGVRDLYVGSLIYIPADIFQGFDYTALGHLHIPQEVSQTKTIRYSGSPIAMGFNEANHTKSVVKVTFSDVVDIQTITIPKFKALYSIKGNASQILEKISSLKGEGYLEVLYDSQDPMGSLRETIEEKLSKTSILLLRTKNLQSLQTSLKAKVQTESLNDLSVEEVFERRLEGISDEKKVSLRITYQEALKRLFEEDQKA